ncbi:hypothetical protein L6452_03785 [Arctium lappa]|uniref:Uncharacterized protein n=1 Tax=Arctium lappa TaxID=4217 RepID=A0ACB9FP43_ARCLA|nr:hypothetical protein L6452_03785 [Arctium lappa]
MVWWVGGGRGVNGSGDSSGSGSKCGGRGDEDGSGEEEYGGNVLGLLELSEEERDSTMRKNLTGTWLVSKYICIHMHNANLRGSIINISSNVGLDRPQSRGSLAYSTSKMGVVTLTKVMALELGTYKTRVNSINPRLFRSEITEVLMEKDWINHVAQRFIGYVVQDITPYIVKVIFDVNGGDFVLRDV